MLFSVNFLIIKLDKMKANLKKRLAKVNDKLSRNGFRTINEDEAITFNQVFDPESGQDGGWKAISYCKPFDGIDVERFFNRKDAMHIGDTLIDISRTYSGVDIY
jgi:hypothetical protein